MNFRLLYFFYLFFILIKIGFFLRIETICKRRIDFNIIEIHEKYKQLKYLESNNVSIVAKLHLIEKSSFINSTYQYKPNLFKDISTNY